jgi:hypothetical protein
MCSVCCPSYLLGDDKPRQVHGPLVSRLIIKATNQPISDSLQPINLKMPACKQRKLAARHPF